MANGGYRKIIILCIIVVFGVSVRMTETLLCVKAADKKTPDDLKLYAQSAVLMDGESGRVLFAKNGEVERPMASTTKIMTCILALELGKGTDVVTVSKKAAAQPEVHLGMREGDTFYLEDLLYSIMLESHNDSAWAIAEHIAGSVENFTDLMDKKAKDLGFGHTNFVTPNGLDGEDADGIHHTTAEDLARIMKYCIMESPQKDAFLQITQTKSKTFQDTTGKKQYVCNNHNAFLSMMEGALTGKTGFTGEAGYCYVGAVRQGDRTLIVALLACGWPNNKNYKWADMKTLVQYGLNQYGYCNYWEDAMQDQDIRILEAGKKRTVKDAPAKDGNLYQDGTVNTFLNIDDQDREKRILMKKTEAIQVQIEEKQEITAPIESGDILGTVTILLNGETLDEKPIVSGESIQKKNLLWIYRQLWKSYAL